VSTYDEKTMTGADNHAELRRKVRASARGIIPDTHLDEVVDLALHAVSQSFKAIGDIVSRASIAPAAVAATSIALSLVRAEAEEKLEGLQGVAEACGLTCTVKTVKLGERADG